MSGRGFSLCRKIHGEDEMAQAIEDLGSNVVLDIFMQYEAMEKAQLDSVHRAEAQYRRTHPNEEYVRSRG